MLVGDSNPRYLAELNGSRVYCDDIATAKAHLDYWSKQQLHCWGRSLVAAIAGRLFLNSGGSTFSNCQSNWHQQPSMVIRRLARLWSSKSHHRRDALPLKSD